MDEKQLNISVRRHALAIVFVILIVLYFGYVFLKYVSLLLGINVLADFIQSLPNIALTLGLFIGTLTFVWLFLRHWTRQ